MVNKKQEPFTIGSRKSQFYTRVYNKTADDVLNYPAPENKAIIRFEIEIHRIHGDLVLDHSFDEDFTNKIFEQRIKVITKKDKSNFINKYFLVNKKTTKIRTVKRKLGNIEKSVDYVFEAYKPYIIAGIKSEAFINKYINSKDTDLSIKTKKIITVLNEKERKE